MQVETIPAPALGSSVIELLVERWPLTFAIYERRRRPLKVGIYYELVAELDGVVDAGELKATIGCYCANIGYVRACCFEGADRVDLAGNVAGVVTAEQAGQARRRVARYKERRAAKRRTAMVDKPAATTAKVEHPAAPPTAIAANDEHAAAPRAPPARRLSLNDLKAAAARRSLRAG